MARKVKKTRTKPGLAEDIRASLQEALKYARGEKADVTVHRVVPSHTDAREARRKLGLEVIRNKPKAVRRAIAKRNSAA